MVLSFNYKFFHMPFFSIIIPVYNVAPYLRECLDSVLVQTFTDWEAICVDDGSTDSSSAILDEYAARDPRFRIVHKNNEGVSIARNIALGAASGKYITFVDSDDVVLCDWLRVYRDVIAKVGCDIVRANFRHWYGDSVLRTIDGTNYSLFARYTTKKDIYSICVPEALRNGYSFVNCIRRAILSGVNFPVGVRIMEDSVFSAQALSKANSVSVIDYAGYLYRVRENSAIHSHIDSQLLVFDRCNLFKALGKFWSDYCLHEIKPEHLPPIRLAVTKFALTHTLMIISSTRRSIISPGLDYRRLAEVLRELYKLGAFDMSALGLTERLAFTVYIRTFAWRSMLLLWKAKAGKVKLAKFFGKS